MTLPAIARHLTLAVRTSCALAAEDPALFAVQVARRLPRQVAAAPARVLRSGPPGSTAQIVGCWLVGWRDEARAAVATRTRRLGHVAAEVAAELDALEPSRAHPPAAARAAWRRGDVHLAIATAPPGSALRRRLGDELAMLTEDLPSARRPAVARPRSAPQQVTALHLLVNSLPTTTSGYALRSHAVLRAQRAAGIDALATTRLGYPVNIGLLTGRDLDVVDGVPYHRLVRWSSPRLPRERLDRQVLAATDLAVRCGVRAGAGLVHATTPFTNALVAQRVAATLGVPWVYEVRGLLEDTWAASFPTPAARCAAAGSQRHALARAREAQMAAAADHVVVLGATVRDSLVERGVREERITIIGNGVDEALLTRTTDPADARAQLGLDREGFWVGTVSSLVDYEGVDTLLEAVAALRSHMDVRVAVVGDGVARPALVRRAASLGLDVVMPGRVSPADAVTWYQALDVFVVPRRDTAVTRAVVPLKPMAAMALRRPVVASDLPALREIVGDVGAGLMVRPDDPPQLAQALATLADDRDRSAHLAQAGHRFAATRTWSSLALAYRELYERLCAQVGAPEGLAA
ncbi:MAG: glycosyltransferase family 4 protein [Micrococcales bacterium]|nr:glycosyltransferase family 4 protein [Micrococcales bacterium]MCL2666165.1 glycosyltransferase family 4 protein [Micrococcales bacterium]